MNRYIHKQAQLTDSDALHQVNSVMASALHVSLALCKTFVSALLATDECCQKSVECYHMPF